MLLFFKPHADPLKFFSEIAVYNPWHPSIC